MENDARYVMVMETADETVDVVADWNERDAWKLEYVLERKMYAQ